MLSSSPLHRILNLSPSLTFCRYTLCSSAPPHGATAAAAAKSLQSCPTLCDPIDGSPPGSPIPGVLQARNWSGLPFPPPMHETIK